MTINVPSGKYSVLQLFGLKQDGTTVCPAKGGTAAVDDYTAGYVAVQSNSPQTGFELAVVPKFQIPTGATKTVNVLLSGVKDDSSGIVLPDTNLSVVFNGPPPPPQVAFSVGTEAPTFGDVANAPADPGTPSIPIF